MRVCSDGQIIVPDIGAAPIALYDGLAFCKLLEDHDVAVVRTRFHIAIPDLELLEAIRG